MSPRPLFSPFSSASAVTGISGVSFPEKVVLSFKNAILTRMTLPIEIQTDLLYHRVRVLLPSLLSVGSISLQSALLWNVDNVTASKDEALLPRMKHEDTIHINNTEYRIPNPFRADINHRNPCKS